MTDRTRSWLWLALPVLITLLLYLPACFGADWVVDGRPLIRDHMHPGDILGEWLVPTHAHAANRPGYLWRPLTSSLYQVWAGLFGRTPTPFRVLNVLLHLANLGLLFAVARRVGAGIAVAGLLATAWAVHPLLPDVVCWMADTYDLLASAWLLLALLLALSRRPSLWLRAAGGGLLFLLALLSKEASLSWLAALPLVLLLLRSWRDALVHLLSLAPIAMAHSVWHTAIVGHFKTSAFDLLARGWVDFLGLWTDYLRWPLTMPVRAGFTHLVVPGGQPIAWVGVAVLLIGAAGLAHGGARGRHLAAAVATWALMISPGALAALSFGQQSSRYLYLPMAVATPLLGGAIPRRLPTWAASVLVVAWSLVWLPMTVPRIAAWQGEHSLFAQEWAFEPHNTFAMKGYGRLLVGEGQVEEGLRLWYRALQNPPQSSFVMDAQAERLDFAQVAAQAGMPALALDQIDVFIAKEGDAGRQVDPSVLAFRSSLSPP
ncbi:MAG: hypothetical protein GXP62_15265 [Oligoflexia bacterium]|nr:hypothetical protein [Oligoflexia bacterium]